MFLTNNKYQKKTDESLMESIKQGNIAAFDQLYERYNGRLLHYFFRMLGRNEEKAQDFLQDIFLKIIEKPNLFDSQKRFSTWIFAVASNMCKNEYRRLSVRTNGKEFVTQAQGFGSDPILPNIERHLDNEQFKKMVFAEIEQWKAVRRDTFLFRYQEHFSIKEISEIMNCSQGTVKSRLFYITKSLAEKLQLFNPKNKING